MRDLQEQYRSALIHNKRLIEQNAEAMVIIGHLQQEIDVMQVYDDISKATEDTNAHK